MRSARFLSFTALSLIAASASAQVDPQPPTQLFYKNLTAVRVNPLGLVDLGEIAFRLRLFESDSDIAKQNFIGAGAVVGISPAWGRVGALVEVQPLTILRLYASYEFMGYFSSFDLMSSYPSANEPFSDSVIRDRVETAGREAYATYGGMLTLGTSVQLKVGPIAARFFFRAMHQSFDLRDGDVVFYDQLQDLLVPNDGWTIHTDTDLLWVSDFGLVVGARWTYSLPIYDATRHFAPGETSTSPPNDLHRVGPLIAYRFADHHGARFDQPTVLLLAQWHLVHRWRTGQDVTTALPYIGLGFQFQGDLLSDR
jgi:hypothetical protein